MKVLVTGGAGFVGSHTVDILLQHGHEVTVLDSFEPQVHGTVSAVPPHLAHYIAHGDIQFVQGNVENRELLKRLLEHCEAVIHLAAALGTAQSAHEPHMYCLANALGTATLMDVLLKEKTQVRKLVVASSASIYGEGCGWNPVRKVKVSPVRWAVDMQQGQWEPRDPEDGTIVEPRPITEDYPLKPTSVYALTKYFTEQVALLSGHKQEIGVICLRYTNIYGPRQSLSNPYTGPLAIFCSRFKSGKPPLVFEDGKQSRDFIHVKDVARANLLSIESSLMGAHVMNIGTGKATSLLEIIALLQEKMQVDIQPTIIQKARIGDIRHSFLDTKRAETLLGFKAQIPVHEGILDTIHALDGAYIEDKVDVALQELAQYHLITDTAGERV
ncbi:dTDP-L-rhamnose 4-epimerase [Thermosporothrix hazakensis]|jgi:dTDP-L-rhamnose 4-epimerase|uniref:UDP-glucose 4-epimerase n=1 Tax=Thermosporothrix hazakensis TaxID=644383 RepID=A0A326U851_THEHA|nr:NAD-dependent epimerase/dehydratase family protein [Thermosporothrix hazakensis]PZW31916.1 dTDP-L-rhamnose 4-epimerase [Thermosporothrix hazakensis]GCE49759.1 nucleoside-diphosphate-sugar epimerase [Thermosporothrix hazakensis]